MHIARAILHQQAKGLPYFRLRMPLLHMLDGLPACRDDSPLSVN
jgi:hypothetical protein